MRESERETESASARCTPLAHLLLTGCCVGRGGQVKALPGGWHWDGDWFVDTTGCNSLARLRDAQVTTLPLQLNKVNRRRGCQLPRQTECTLL
jgi:hypothetical protein